MSMSIHLFRIEGFFLLYVYSHFYIRVSKLVFNNAKE